MVEFDTMQNQYKRFTIPLILAAIVIVAVIGIYFYSHKNAVVSTNTPTAASQATTTPTQSNKAASHPTHVVKQAAGTKATTAQSTKPGLETYTNEQYDFSIDYPINTAVDTTPGKQIEKSTVSGKVALFKPAATKGSLTIEAEPSAYCSDTTDGATPSHKTINGTEFTVYNLDRILNTGTSLVTAREYCTIRNGTKLKFITQLPYTTAVLQVEGDPVLNQILASFRFN